MQSILLLINALLFIVYLYLTYRLRKTAERQVEASFRPALIVIFEPSLKLARVQNVEHGPALEVEWALEHSDVKGKIPFFRTEDPPQYLQLCNREEFAEAAGRGKVEKASIVCRYESLSGSRYSSTSTCEPFRLAPVEFTTTFSER